LLNVFDFDNQIFQQKSPSPFTRLQISVSTLLLTIVRENNNDMRHTQLSGRELLAAACIVFLWGTNFVAMKIGLHSFTPFQLGAARYLFAMLPLILFVRPPRLHWKWLLLYGMCQGFGQFALLFVSLKVGMTAALASVLMQTQVFFTALFSFFVLAEKSGKPLLAGMGLAALGLCCFAMNYLLPATGATGATAATTLLGFSLCLAAASMWAASNIVVRLVQNAARLRRIELPGLVQWGTGGPFCLPVAAI
jgi:O-acetylserine/cysteine efflux transporter